MTVILEWERTGLDEAGGKPCFGDPADWQGNHQGFHSGIFKSFFFDSNGVFPFCGVFLQCVCNAPPRLRLLRLEPNSNAGNLAMVLWVGQFLSNDKSKSHFKVKFCLGWVGLAGGWPDIWNGESRRTAGGWSCALVPKGPRILASYAVAGHGVIDKSTRPARNAGNRRLTLHPYWGGGVPRSLAGQGGLAGRSPATLWRANVRLSRRDENARVSRLGF